MCNGYSYAFLMGGGDRKKSAEGKLQHGGRWLHAREWSLLEAEPLMLYLQDDMSLSSQSLAEPPDLATGLIRPGWCRPSAAP
ncbi:hypothetical protein [Sodalis glossinidius]|uniref:hypothetical protein n=1 Tax=Sodalis glossinidius TaxID=63612 RepID=UPI00068111CA|nr:hypothetical protein [Sodalis glossinidius]